MRFDGNAAFTLKIHRIKRLLFKLSRRNSLGQFENPVGKRSLAVVDVCDNAEIANVIKRYHRSYSMLAKRHSLQHQTILVRQ